MILYNSRKKAGPLLDPAHSLGELVNLSAKHRVNAYLA